MIGQRLRVLTTRSGRSLAFTELGMGTAPLGNLYHAIDEATAQATLQAAWDAGTRYFDTAPLYGFGLAETRLNHFLRGRRRDDYVLSTKAGRLLKVCSPEKIADRQQFFDTPSREINYDYSYDGMMRSFEISLERLGLDRIDILLCHDVDAFTHGSRLAADQRVREFMSGGYRALHDLRSQGVVAAIGAGVNEWEVCQTLACDGDFDIFLLAGRYTLLEQLALDTFLPLCREKAIGIAIGGPFNSGILASGAKPDAHFNYQVAPPEILDRVGRIEKVCARHRVRLADAALRFPLGHPSVISVIPGAVTPAEVKGNAAALGAPIPSTLWAELKSEKLLRADAPVPD
jgi:D-threo-aldose 1-dehydrogenase